MTICEPIPELTQEVARAIWKYSPATGVFKFIHSRGSRCGGHIAGCLDTKGYWRIAYKQRYIRAQNLAWLWVKGEWPTFEIDHRDRIRSNNKWSNLRPATRSEQVINSDIRSDNKTGFRGVYFDQNKWHAVITFNKQRYYLGTFSSAEDAASARALKLIELLNE